MIIIKNSNFYNDESLLRFFNESKFISLKLISFNILGEY